MKKKLLILFFTCVVQLLAQQGSSLFPIITADLPIERNVVFRDLQQTLSDENARQLSGLSLPILHMAIDKYKDQILSYLEPPQINPDGKSFFFSYRGHKIFSFSIDTNKTIGEGIGESRKKLDSLLHESVKNIADSYFSNNKKVYNLFFFICFKLLENNNSENYTENKSYDSLTILYLTNNWSDKILAGLKMLNIQPDQKLNKEIGDLSEKFNDTIKDIAANLKVYIIQQFNLIHTEINDQIEKPLRDKFKGITGISMSEGSGVFSGGILYSLNILNNMIRTSFYTNANFSSTQDTAIHSLIGTKIDLVNSKLQFSFLYAIYFGDKEFKIWNAYELGTGINYNIGGSTVLGLAYFYTRNGTPAKDWIQYSAGVSLKLSDSSPSFILGLSTLAGSNHIKPIFQISYPINPSK